MKKYKLLDLVAPGSNARRKVDSDLLVGDVSAGYGRGDILDANATMELIKELAQESSGVDEEIKDKIEELEAKHEQYEALHEEQERAIEEIRESAVLARVEGSVLLIGSL